MERGVPTTGERIRSWGGDLVWPTFRLPRHMVLDSVDVGDVIPDPRMGGVAVVGALIVVARFGLAAVS
jgi:hypothetical protein